MNAPDVVNSPDVLKTDPNSMEFYILKDEQVVICKNRQDLPYHKNRQTYLSSGRFSPEFKKVVFWPSPVNPMRAMKLLEEGMHIGSDFTYAISGSDRQVTKSKKTHKPVDKLDGVRKRRVEVLIQQGMKLQENDPDNNSQKTADGASNR